MDLLVEEVESNANSEGIRAYEEWVATRDRILRRGKAPTSTARTVTQIAATAARTAHAQVRIERTDVQRDRRPGGARFGALVHTILAEVSLAADAGDVRAIASSLGRVVGATEDETRAAVEAVCAALDHPLLKCAGEAATLGECRRELPVTMRMEDGSLAEGVVDLAFRDKGGDPHWVVVDFKTDAELDTDGRYAVQVGLYVRAIADLTGERAEGVLLSV